MWSIVSCENLQKNIISMYQTFCWVLAVIHDLRDCLETPRASLVLELAGDWWSQSAPRMTPIIVTFTLVNWPCTDLHHTFSSGIVSPKNADFDWLNVEMFIFITSKFIIVFVVIILSASCVFCIYTCTYRITIYVSVYDFKRDARQCLTLARPAIP